MIARIDNVLGLDRPMKALSVTQPWASLIALGSKRVETRSWYTTYRGPVVIHAAKGYPGWCKDLAETETFQQGLKAAPAKSLPVGVGLCVVTILGCVKTTELHKLQAIDFHLSCNEITFGDFDEGRWAWALDLQYQFIEPVPATGALGLWEWPHEQFQVALP